MLELSSARGLLKKEPRNTDHHISRRDLISAEIIANVKDRHESEKNGDKGEQNRPYPTGV